MMKNQLLNEKIIDEIAEKAANKVIIRLDALSAAKDMQQFIDALNELFNS